MNLGYGELFIGEEDLPSGTETVLVECGGEVKAKLVVVGNNTHLWVAEGLRIFERPDLPSVSCEVNDFIIQDGEGNYLGVINENGLLTINGGFMERGIYRNHKAQNEVRYYDSAIF